VFYIIDLQYPSPGTNVRGLAGASILPPSKALSVYNNNNK